MQSAEASVAPEVCAEIRGDGLRVPPKKDSEEHQSEQRRNFCGSEDILNNGARLHAENIDDRERDHYQDGGKILRVQSHIHAAEHHGADLKLWHFPDVDNPITRGDCRPEYSEEFAEGNADGSDRARLNHEEQSPAVE